MTPRSPRTSLARRLQTRQAVEAPRVVVDEVDPGAVADPEADAVVVEEASSRAE